MKNRERSRSPMMPEAMMRRNAPPSRVWVTPQPLLSAMPLKTPRRMPLRERRMLENQEGLFMGARDETGAGGNGGGASGQFALGGRHQHGGGEVKESGDEPLGEMVRTHHFRDEQEQDDPDDAGENNRPALGFCDALEDTEEDAVTGTMITVFHNFWERDCSSRMV